MNLRDRIRGHNLHTCAISLRPRLETRVYLTVSSEQPTQNGLNKVKKVDIYSDLLMKRYRRYSAKDSLAGDSVSSQSTRRKLKVNLKLSSPAHEARHVVKTPVSSVEK